MDRSTIYAHHTPSNLTSNSIKVWLGAGYATSDLQDVRRSRHVAGLLRCLTVETSSSPLPGWPPQREPRTNAGNAGRGVAGSSSTGTTAAQPSTHAVFSPAGTALTWLENNESKLTSWHRFAQDFDRSSRLNRRCSLAPKSQASETCPTYTGAVLKLGRLVDP